MLVALSPLLLDTDLGPDPAWMVPVIGLAAAGLTLAVGFVVGRRRPRLPASPAPEVRPPAAPPAPADDPFVQGSKSERRAAIRREGNLVAVEVTMADGQGRPVSGWVMDRSVGGLGLRLDEAMAVGVRLNVRPRNAPTMVPWTPVEVKSCRQEGKNWEVGCRFVRTPPWSVLLQFG